MCSSLLGGLLSEFKKACREMYGLEQDARRANIGSFDMDIEVTSWLVSADDFSSRVARGANERVSAANE